MIDASLNGLEIEKSTVSCWLMFNYFQKDQIESFASLDNCFINMVSVFVMINNYYILWHNSTDGLNMAQPLQLSCDTFKNI